MKRNLRYMYLLKILLMVVILTSCKNSILQPSSFTESLLEVSEDGRIKISYILLDGEDVKVIEVVPGITYQMDYELRVDEGFFDIKITNTEKQIIYAFPNTDQNIENYKIHGNSNLYIIGGTANFKTVEDNIILIITGKGASGYLKLNFE